MPFVRSDYTKDELGSFDYCPAEELAYEPRPFDPGQLTGAAGAAYAMLRAIGVGQFRVRYDGGHDEGFAHADGGRGADGQDWPLDRLVAELMATGQVDALRAKFGNGEPNPRTGRVPYYMTVPPEKLVALALDDLGNEMASCLLGQGYGTGEYSMYGVLTADLTTGTLTDEPSAHRPPDVPLD